jgi:hypothetical protein
MQAGTRAFTIATAGSLKTGADAAAPMAELLDACGAT